MKKKLHVKTGDKVMIISGKDKGKQGEVLEVSPKEGKLIIENLNVVTKHMKPRKMGEKGGIVKAEGALYACKVMPICPKCGKPTRVGHVIQKGEKGKKDKKVRACKHQNCGGTF